MTASEKGSASAQGEGTPTLFAHCQPGVGGFWWVTLAEVGGVIGNLRRREGGEGWGDLMGKLACELKGDGHQL